MPTKLNATKTYINTKINIYKNIFFNFFGVNLDTNKITKPKTKPIMALSVNVKMLIKMFNKIRIRTKKRFLFSFVCFILIRLFFLRILFFDIVGMFAFVAHQNRRQTTKCRGKHL